MEEKELPMETEPTTSEEATVQETVEIKTEPVDFAKFQAETRAYCDNFVRLIRFSKAKDENLSKLTQEVQKHREDFALKLVKPVCVSLISLREDYGKTLAEVEKFARSTEDVLKYVDYMQLDFEELLAERGVERVDSTFMIDGKPLSEKKPRKAIAALEEQAEAPAEEIAVTEAPAEEAPEQEASFEAMLNLIRTSFEKLEAEVRKTEAQDELIATYRVLASSVDDNYADAILLPLYKELADVCKELERRGEELKAGISEENKAEKYEEVLRYAVNEIDKMLLECGVQTLQDAGDDYDMKYCRILKVVPTEDEALDKKVAKRYSACYAYKDKVLYPSKVDVYKYTQK